jgi:hypothetical protein
VGGGAQRDDPLVMGCRRAWEGAGRLMQTIEELRRCRRRQLLLDPNRADARFGGFDLKNGAGFAADTLLAQPQDDTESL